MIGRTIAHYEVLEKLGEGGMGVVYKARDSHLKRFVALKVLPPEKVADAERKHRFVQKARSASALNHPNIVTVYDIDQSDGIDFIATECVEGNYIRRAVRVVRFGQPILEVPDGLRVGRQLQGFSGLLPAKRGSVSVQEPTPRKSEIRSALTTLFWETGA